MYSKHNTLYPKIMVLVLLLLSGATARSQRAKDTAAMFKALNTVMSFTTRQYLHYSTTTRLSAIPVLTEQDTAIIKGSYYKNHTEVYAINGPEEQFLQDSLLVEVNHTRKSIWLKKVDVASKVKMNQPVAGSLVKEAQLLEQKDFIISQEQADKSTGRFILQGRHTSGGSSTTITLDYNLQTQMPSRITVAVVMRQPADEATLAALKEEHIDEDKLIQQIDDVRYFVRQQQMTIDYTAIDTDAATVIQMPQYKNCIHYDAATGQFTGIGSCERYEVTQLF